MRRNLSSTLHLYRSNDNSAKGILKRGGGSREERRLEGEKNKSCVDRKEEHIWLVWRNDAICNKFGAQGFHFDVSDY